MREKIHLHIVQSVEPGFLWSGDVPHHFHLEHHAVHGPALHDAQLSGQAFKNIFKFIIKDQYYV